MLESTLMSHWNNPAGMIIYTSQHFIWFFMLNIFIFDITANNERIEIVKKLMFWYKSSLVYIYLHKCMILFIMAYFHNSNNLCYTIISKHNAYFAMVKFMQLWSNVQMWQYASVIAHDHPEVQNYCSGLPHTANKLF